jgi:hypothetical protein
VRSLLVPVLAVLALGLVGCSEETPGDATAGDGTNRPTIPGGDTPTDVPTESSEPGGGSGTADLVPCDLLSASELATFDVGAGVEEEIGPARTCLWQASGQQTISVGVIDELGVADVQSSGAKEPTTVGAHDAVQYAGPLGACAIAIGVTETSRVDVTGSAGGDMTKACGVAKQAAELVEAKLP